MPHRLFAAGTIKDSRFLPALISAAAALVGLAPLTASAAPTSAPAPSAAPNGSALVQPALLVDAAALVPGQTVAVALKLTIADGWHLYWAGLNDSGAPTEPGTITATILGSPAATPPATNPSPAPWLWPAAERHIAEGDILDYVYHHQAVLLTEFTVPPSAKPGQQLTLTINPRWLVCSDSCLPGKGSASITLPIAAEPAKPLPATAAVFAAARAALPRNPTPADGLSVTWQSPQSLTIRVAGAKRLVFAPAESSLPIANPIASGARDGDSLPLTIPDAPASANQPSALDGVLSITPADGSATRHLRIRTSPPSPPAPPAAAPAAQPPTKR